jgi:hypothetical protein
MILFLIAIGIDRLSLLKCKFIIGVSCVVITLSFYLVVSEQRINIHLVSALTNLF